jgi:hypothetical protein
MLCLKIGQQSHLLNGWNLQRLIQFSMTTAAFVGK